MSPAPVPHPHTSGSPLPAATDTLRAVSSMTHCTQEILWSSSGHQMGSKAPTALAPAFVSHFPPGWIHNFPNTAVPTLLRALTDNVSLPASLSLSQACSLCWLSVGLLVGSSGAARWGQGHPDLGNVTQSTAATCPVQPSGSREEIPTGRITAAQRSPGTSMEEARLRGLADKCLDYIPPHPQDLGSTEKQGTPLCLGFPPAFEEMLPTFAALLGLMI